MRDGLDNHQTQFDYIDNRDTVMVVAGTNDLICLANSDRQAHISVVIDRAPGEDKTEYRCFQFNLLVDRVLINCKMVRKFITPYTPTMIRSMRSL